MIERSPLVTLREASLLAFSKCIVDIWKQSGNGLNRHRIKSIVYIQDGLRAIPLHLVDKVFLKIITRLMITDIEIDRKLSKKIGDFIVKILCDLRVSNLCLVKVNEKFLLRIIDNLHHMTSLQILSMSLFAPVQSVTFAVMQMKLLTKFTHWDCADEIISALAISCRNLQVLDVCNSRGFTDKSMNDLLECKSLKYIDIADTSVSHSGFASVLNNIPTLEALIYCRTHDALESLGNIHFTNILEIGRVLYCDLTKVAQLFPNLKHIEVDMENSKVDEELRYLFPHLQSMFIEDAHFHDNNISEMLVNRKFCLIKLELTSVECLDTTALEEIAESCPNLEVLELYFCNSEDQPLLTNRCRYYSRANFENLKKLDIIESIVDVEFISSRGPNITHLKIIEHEPVCSRAFLDHVHENPLKKLKDLYICIEKEFLEDSFVLEALKSCGYIEKVIYYQNSENLNIW